MWEPRGCQWWSGSPAACSSSTPPERRYDGASYLAFTKINLGSVFLVVNSQILRSEI